MAKKRRASSKEFSVGDHVISAALGSKPEFPGVIEEEGPCRNQWHVKDSNGGVWLRTTRELRKATKSEMV